MTIPLPLITFAALVVAAPFTSRPLASKRAPAQSTDTLRVGSATLARIPIRTDTFDFDFQMQTAAGIERTRSISIFRTTMEVRGKDSVVHAKFTSERKPYWDVYLDPRTLGTIQYEQHTEIDSLVITRSGDCFTGWVDLEKVARRNVTCDRHTDRFAGTPMDEHLIALVPLRAGMTAVLATYGAVYGDAGGYPFTVLAQDTLTLRGRQFRAWQVERRMTTDYGTLVTKMWIDVDQPRALRFTRDFPNGRRSVMTLRNP